MKFITRDCAANELRVILARSSGAHRTSTSRRDGGATAARCGTRGTLIVTFGLPLSHYWQSSEFVVVHDVPGISGLKLGTSTT